MEIIDVYTWLYTTLAANSTITNAVSLRIHDGLSPDGVFPLITFNWMGGTDVSAVGSIRIFNSGLFQVKAIAEDMSYTSISPIALKIDQLLHRATGTVNTHNIECAREYPLALIENKNAIQYRHLGGVYRIYIT